MWLFIAISVLSLLCAIALTIRLFNKRNALIFATILARLFISVAAFLAAINGAPLERGSREWNLLWAFLALFVVELINHISTWRFPYLNGRHPS